MKLNSHTDKMYIRFCVLSTFLLMFISPHVTGQSQKITLIGDNITLQQTFESIEKQTPYNISYNQTKLNVQQAINANYKNATVGSVLHKVLASTGFTYKQDGNYLVIVPASEQMQPAQTPSTTESKMLKGVVVDRENRPIPGASVVEKGTTNATITDQNGNFTMKLLRTNRILVSYIGYIPQDLAAVTGKTMRVMLEENTNLLNEVVVIGYGSKKKANLLGAVSTVGANELKDRPVSNLGQALQGQIPNLNITFASGTPGEATRLNIRGVTSIVNSGAPLVLIDGVAGNLDLLNPNDIESVSVLKDAASAAIYGARAGFGVILVTTKSSKDGKPRIQYNGRYSFSGPTTRTDFISTGYDAARIVDAFNMSANGSSYTNFTASDYAQLEARKNDKTENPSRPWTVVGSDGKYRYYANFDWYNYLFNFEQPNWNNNISISGGNKKFNYMTSANFNDKNGIYALNTDKYSTNTFTNKMSTQVNSWLDLSTTAMLYKSKYNSPGYDYEDGGNFGNLTFHAMPYVMPYNPDGSNVYTYAPSPNKPADGFAAMIREGKGFTEVKKTQAIYNAKATAHLLPGLDLIGNINYRRYNKAKTFRSAGFTYSEQPGVLLQANSGFFSDQLKEYATTEEYYVYDLYATYQKLLHEKHQLNVVMGMNHETGSYKNIGASVQSLLSSSLNDLVLGTGNKGVYGGQRQYALLGYFGRLSYDYEGKYLTEINMRYDGTSRFPSNSRWGFFPSIAVGWRLSDEKFFNPLKPTIDNLKLRASYGSLGNQVTDGYANPYYPFVRRAQVKTSNSLNYIFNNQIQSYIQLDAPVSGSLTWEKIFTRNLGIDLGFFKDRLSTTLDLYQRDTKDMLAASLTLPNVYGYAAPLENNGNLRTRGYEISVGWNDRFMLSNKPFKYGFTVSLSDSKSKLVKYMGNTTKNLSSRYEGMEWGEIWGYRIEGIYQTDQQAIDRGVDQTFINTRFTNKAGDLIFADLNGDKKVNNGKGTLDDHGDLVKLGNSTPRYLYSFNLSASWSGFDASLFFQGIGKQNLYPGQNNMFFWGPFSRAYSSFIPADFESKVWTTDNKDAYFPRAAADLARWGTMSKINNRYLQDLAYCRLKNITVGYTLPHALTQKALVDQIRFYFSGENLLTLTKLKNNYLDPEQMTTDSNGRVYPYSKTFSFGLDVTF